MATSCDLCSGRIPEGQNYGWGAGQQQATVDVEHRGLKMSLRVKVPSKLAGAPRDVCRNCMLRAFVTAVMETG